MSETSTLAASIEVGHHREAEWLGMTFNVDTIIASVQKTNRLVTCEEGWAFSGIGSEIAALIMEQAFDHLVYGVARFDHQHDAARFFQHLRQFRHRMRADDLRACCFVLQKFIYF